MTASNIASKARAALLKRANKCVQAFKEGDATIVLHIPGHAQGQIICVQQGVTAQQCLGALKAVQAGYIESRKKPDPRLEKLIGLVQEQVAAEEAVAGRHDQW